MFIVCVCGKSTYSLDDECQYCSRPLFEDHSETEPYVDSMVFDKKQMRLFDVEVEQG